MIMSFKSLVSAVSEQCQEMKQALSLFSYFETWDENIIAECCRLGSIVEFPPDKIILGSHTKNTHVVHFILDGICQLIQHLHVHVKIDSYGRSSYRLYRAEDSNSSNSESSNAGYVSLLFNGKHDFQKNVESETPEIDELLKKEKMSDEKNEITEFDDGTENEQEEGIETEVIISSKDNTEGVLELEKGEHDCEDNITLEADQNQMNEKSTDVEIRESQDEEKEKTDEIEATENGEKIDDRPREPSKSDVPEKETETAEQEEVIQPEIEKSYDLDHHLKVLEECKMKSKLSVRLIEKESLPKKPSDVKSFFMEIGLLHKGACIGFEKNMSERFIITATRVKCLRIPKSFLLQHNPCNIWNKVRLFLDLYLPSDEKIFEYFLSNRKWAERKRKETNRIALQKNIPNNTLTYDVPYSIRLMQKVYLSE